MANVEKYGDLILGSGIAGKFTAWTRDSRCCATQSRSIDNVRRFESAIGEHSRTMRPVPKSLIERHQADE